jgi:hypothetical protein
MPARLPSATASTTSRPPFTQSPPAKYFGRLPDRKHDHVYGQPKSLARFRHQRPILRRFKFDKFQRLNSIATLDVHWLYVPKELHSLDLRVLILKRKCRHLVRPAPIDNMHFSCSQSHSRIRRINRGISRPDHRYSFRNRRNMRALVSGDKIQRIRYAWQLLSRNPELVNRAQPNTKKHRVMR